MTCLLSDNLADDRKGRNVEKREATAHAHTPNASGRWQPLNEHLENVAQLASQFGAAFGGDDVGFWLGLWHDLGKYSQAFQAYLQDCARSPGRTPTRA